MPPGSLARSAIALGPWRGSAVGVALFNLLAVLPTIRSHPSSVGAFVALGCAVFVLMIVAAQMRLLRDRAPRRSPAAEIGATTHEPEPLRVEVPGELRTRLRARELGRGLAALAIGIGISIVHAVIVFT